MKAAILGAWMAEELSPSTPDKLTRAAIRVAVEQCAQECEWEAVNFKRAGGSSKGMAEACAARIRATAEQINDAWGETFDGFCVIRSHEI